jgi:CPA1 family monovalent cation:H+ antiporter
MTLSVQAGVLLLLIAAVVAMLAQRFRLPYSAGLVASGIVLSLIPLPFTFALTKELIYTLLLPPLLFEAAFQLEWRQLRKNLPVVAVLATVGVLLSALITATGLHFLMNWKWASALIFGALIAATDPVSVLATLKEAGAQWRLRLLLEAESLLNDGTAAIAFVLVVALAQGGDLSIIGAIKTVAIAIAGGILCGILVAFAVLLLAGRTQDHLIEITFTAIAAYGSFLLADHFGASGILATITAGLVMSNQTCLSGISPQGKDAIDAFWEYAAFLANSIIFILIGVHEAHQNYAAIGFVVIPAIALVMLGRAVAVFPCCAAFWRTSLRVTAKHQVVLFWCGLRGALALALAMGLPPEIPMREEIILATFATVAFSVFIQGLTTAPLLRKLGELSHCETPPYE